MSLGIWEFNATEGVNGDVVIIDSPQVEVRRESDGQLATIYEDVQGNTSLVNPFTGEANGTIRFYAEHDELYRIKISKSPLARTLRHQGVTDSADLATLVSKADLADADDPAKGEALVGYKREPGGAARTLHDWLQDQVVNIKDYGAIGNGTSDDSEALQAALDLLDARAAVAIYAPTGDYLIASRAVKTELASKRVALIGDGPELTRFIVPDTNTDGFLKLAHDDRANWGYFRGFSVLADGEGLGTAIQYTQQEGGNRHNRTLYIRDVEIRGVDPATDHFTVGLDFTGCWRPYLDGVLVGGPFGPGVTGDWSDNSPAFGPQVGIVLDDCYSPAIHNVYVWSAEVGIRATSAEAQGPEGFHMSGTKLVHVKQALQFSRTAPEPELWIEHCHVDYRDNGLNINGAKFVTITSFLPYNEDTTPEAGGTVSDIWLRNVEGALIQGCTFHFDGNPSDRIGVFVDASTLARDVTIANNFFTGTFDEAVRVGAGAQRVALFGNRYPGTIATRVVDNTGAAAVLDPDDDPSAWRLESRSATAARGPRWFLDRRSASPANNDALAAIIWRAFNDNQDLEELGSLALQYDNVTDGAEASRFRMFAREGGNLVPVLEVAGTPNIDETALIVRVRNGTSGVRMERVRTGGPNSGGQGFRVLRVPN